MKTDWKRWIIGAASIGVCAIGSSACATSDGAEAESATNQVEQEQVEEEQVEQEPAEQEPAEHHGEKMAGWEHGEDDGEHAHGDHHAKRFEDPEAYAKDWNDPERDAWQQPGDILEAMELEEGMTVADIGTGTGYFIPFLSEAVGEEGRVLAVDVEASMLEYVQERADEQGWDNVETVLAEGGDSGLEESSVDRILLVNTWHHIPEREAYARHLRERLTEGGSVWVVDFTRDSPIGPPMKHRMEPKEVIEELEAAGFDAEVYELELERQFVVVARPQ